MAKKKKKTRPTWSYELRNTIIGWVLVFLGVLVLAGDSGSTAGGFVASVGTTIFGEHYRFIFAPIIIILGGLITINKLSWNMVRLMGLLLFWVSIVSLEGIFMTPFRSGLFDFGTFFVSFLGKAPALVFLVG